MLLALGTGVDKNIGMIEKSKRGRGRLNRIPMETFLGWGWGGGEKSRAGEGKLNQIPALSFFSQVMTCAKFNMTERTA